MGPKSATQARHTDHHVERSSLAARTLLKRPGYAFSVVATLAVGIGASTVMFKLPDAAVLHHLPSIAQRLPQ